MSSVIDRLELKSKTRRIDFSSQINSKDPIGRRDIRSYQDPVLLLFYNILYHNKLRERHIQIPLPYQGHAFGNGILRRSNPVKVDARSGIIRFPNFSMVAGDPETVEYGFDLAPQHVINLYKNI